MLLGKCLQEVMRVYPQQSSSLDTGISSADESNRRGFEQKSQGYTLHNFDLRTTSILQS